MRVSVMLLGLVCLCAMVIGTAAPLPQEQDDVRGAFLTSRPKQKPASSGPATKPNRRRPKAAAVSNNPGKSLDKTPTPVKTDTPATTKTDTPVATSTPLKPVNAPRIGLGLTLFMRDSNGLAVRTDPDHVFQKGDRVRVLLETNTDGYLYIFNTTN